MPYNTNAFGIDLSSWNSDVPLKKGDIDFLFVRLGGSEAGGAVGIYKDTMFDKNVQKAQDIEVPCIAYFFAGPRFWLERQFTTSGVTNLTNTQNAIYKFIHDELMNKNVIGLILDFEDASLKASSGQVTPAWISFFARDIFGRFQKEMDAGTFRKMRMGVYSRKSWMDVSGKDLATWLGTQPQLMIWTANWPSGETSVVPLNQLRTKLPLETSKPMPFGWMAERKPLDWTFWQYGGDVAGAIRVKIQETGGAVDLNMFHGDVATLKAYLNYTVVPPIVVPPTTALETRVLALENKILAEDTRLAALEVKVGTIEETTEFLFEQFNKHLKVI